MYIIHFVPGSSARAVGLVAEAVGRRGWRQTIVGTAEPTVAHQTTTDWPACDVVTLAGGIETAQIMVELERILVADRPEVVLVYGDADGSLAAVLAAVKVGIIVAHVDAGIRSADRSGTNDMTGMLVDRLAALLFTPSEAADETLSREGVTPERVRRVGPLPCDAEAAERIAAHLEAAAQLDGDQPTPGSRHLKARSVERIIEAQI